MADDSPLFKDQLGPARVKALARALKQQDGAFPARAFTRDACDGLEALELKARITHIIAALHRHLPGDYPAALQLLLDVGRSSLQQGEQAEVRGFAAWPLIDYVGEHGLHDPERSLEALRTLTPLFSAEFAIRPFIEADEKSVLKRLTAWTGDRDEHVRRLCSEGTRPRLPWGRRLRSFQRDPGPVLRLLNKLKDDPSEYVRRSVANNLNDIAKDHPDEVVRLCTRWARGASAERKWIIRHATRSLVKQGHADALKLLGFDPGAKLEVSELSATPKRVRVGDDLRVHFELTSTASKPQALVVDYAVHHVKSNGERTPKVFKLKQLTLAPGETVRVDKVHKLRKITTRVYYPGKHAVDVLVNGRPRGSVEFDLRA